MNRFCYHVLNSLRPCAHGVRALRCVGASHAVLLSEENPSFKLLCVNHTSNHVPAAHHQSGKTSVDEVLSNLQGQIHVTEVLKLNIKVLLECGAKLEDISAFCVDQKVVSSSIVLNDVVFAMRDYRFTLKQIVNILTRNPVDKRTLILTFDTLGGLAIQGNRIRDMIASCPELLSQNCKEFLPIYNSLHALFSRADTEQLVTKSPTILTTTRELLEEKLNYLLYDMGLSNKEIVRSNALGHDLFHIQCRHSFLSKLGIFKTPDKHGGHQKVNPRPEFVFNSTDKKLVQDIPHVDEDDYRIFCDMSEMIMD